MKKSIVNKLSVAFLTLVAFSGTALADLFQHVSIDVSSIGGSDFELEIDLFDNAGVIGDSWAQIDNVAYGTTFVDFETGTLEGFDNSLNPSSVGVALGNLAGGSYVLQIDEDPVFTPTITYRDFLPSTATILSFDFKMNSTGTVGPFGQDALVFSILDPVTLSPFSSLQGLNGFGDILEVTDSGALYSPGVTVELVPVPPALLLGMLGIGSGSILLKLRKSLHTDTRSHRTMYRSR